MKIFAKILIIIGIIIVLFNYTYTNIAITRKEPFALENNDVVLSIKKIGIERQVVFTNDIMSTMKNDIALYHTSSYPGEEGTTILLAHSGNVSYAFFKDLDKLDLADEIVILYGGVCYKYKVNEIKIVNEESVKFLENNKKGSSVVLITCKKGDNTKRLVIIANNLL